MVRNPTTKKAVKRKPPARRDKEATRAALLAAGEKLFAARSFEGATFEAIAEESGANKALIAYYFGSKEGFYDAVIAAQAAHVLSEVKARMGEEGVDPAENFRNYVRALTLALHARPSMPAILMREYLSGSMLSREGPFGSILQFFRTTQRLYEAGRKAGAFRELDPHILHLSIVGPIIHFIVAAAARKRGVSLYARDVGDPGAEIFAAGLAQIILDGVRRPD